MARPDDVYLDENERAEQVREWWKRNGPSIVAGVVLGLAAIFGWRAWQRHVVEHQAAAAQVYLAFTESSQALTPEEVAAQLTSIKEEFGNTPYAALAALEAAQLAYGAGKIEQAAEYYRYAISQAQPEGVAAVARMRLARLQTGAGNYDQALATVAKISTPSFQALAAELKGDIYVHQGKIEQAREAYQSALDQAEGPVTQFLQMKLSSLGSGIIAPPEKAAEKS